LRHFFTSLDKGGFLVMLPPAPTLKTYLEVDMELRKVVVLSLGLGLAAFAQGCGNDCDAAADEITAKFEECGITVSGGDGDGSGGECTEEAAAAATCLADCVTAAPCEALDGTDVDAALDYGTCVLDCAG